MKATDRHSGTEEENETTVSMQESCPGTVVFTEEGNTDGWIATDHTVDVRQ